jgi:hypothetical protein
MQPPYRIPVRMERLIFPVLLLVYVPARAQGPDQKTRERVQWFIDDAPRKWFGDTRKAIIAKLGSPVNASVRLNPNPQDTLTADTVFSLRYDSASFVVYAATREKHEFLVEATAAGSRYLRASPLPFGTRLSRVRAYFGDSGRAITSSLTYSCSWCGDPVPGTSVTLWFRGGRLAGAKWEYKID